MNNKKRYKTSFVVDKGFLLEKLFGKQEAEPVEENDDFEEDDELAPPEPTKEELFQNAKSLLMMLKIAVFIVAFIFNLGVGIPCAIVAKPSSAFAIVCVVLSIFTLCFSLRIINEKNVDKLQKRLKTNMAIPLLLSLGSLSYKWVLSVLFLVIFNVVVILGSASVLNGLKVKRSMTKQELIKIISILFFVLMLIAFIFKEDKIEHLKMMLRIFSFEGV